MAGPWEQVVHHGRMRASDADRDRAVEALKAGYLEGLLTSAELDSRTGQVFLARTYAELTAATAVLAVRPRPGPPGKRLGPKVVAAGACAIVLPPVLVAAFVSFYGGFIILFLMACIGLFVSGAPMSQRRPDPPF
jgi:uncharacterized protein DUF1707